MLRGRRVTPERIEEVAHHYELFGGVSPLTAITRRQADGLRSRLTAAGVELPVYVGMRNWHPLLSDTLQQMTPTACGAPIGFICAAHHSYSSCTQYRENVASRAAAIAPAGWRSRRDVTSATGSTIRGSSRPTPGHVRDALNRLPAARARERAPRVHRAQHPDVDGRRWPYAAQLRESARAGRRAARR